MRIVGIFCLLALPFPALASADLNEWAAACLDMGRAEYSTDPCQGFRAGIVYQRERQPAILPAPRPTPAGPPPMILIPGTTDFLSTPEDLQNYLRSGAAEMSSMADAIGKTGQAAAGPPGQLSPPFGTSLPVDEPGLPPGMVTAPDPAGKPLVDF